jgi:hypothetical protein
MADGPLLVPGKKRGGKDVYVLKSNGTFQVAEEITKAKPLGER